MVPKQAFDFIKPFRKLFSPSKGVVAIVVANSNTVLVDRSFVGLDKENLATGALTETTSGVANVPGMLSTPVPAVALKTSSGEVINTFSALGTTYEYSFIVASGQTEYLDYGLSGGTYGVTECNGSACSSTSIAGLDGSIAFGSGSWSVYVTLDSESDPFGGFELSDTPLDLPTPTPLPSTWTMILIGLAGLGFVTYRQSKKAAFPATA